MGLPSRHVLMHERLPLLDPSAISVKSIPVWSYQQGLVLSGDSLELYRDVLGLVGGYQVLKSILKCVLQVWFIPQCGVFHLLFASRGLFARKFSSELG